MKNKKKITNTSITVTITKWLPRRQNKAFSHCSLQTYGSDFSSHVCDNHDNLFIAAEIVRALGIQTRLEKKENMCRALT